MLLIPMASPGITVSRKAAAALCVAGWLIGSALPLAGEESVTGVRFWTLPETTRIAVETSGPFEFKTDRLANPDRIFFDIPGALRLGHKGMSVIPVNDQFLRQIRVAETQRGVTRIVLDLAAPAEANASRIQNPERLMIELHRPGWMPKPQPSPEPPAITDAAPPSARGFQRASAKPAPPQPEPFTVSEATPTPVRVFQPPYMPVRDLSHRSWPAVVLDPPMYETGYAWRLDLRMNDPLAGMMMARRRVPAPPMSPTPAPTTVALVTRSAPTPPPVPVSIAAAPASTPEPIVGSSKPSPTETVTPDRIGLPAKRSTTAREDSMIRALGLKIGRIVIDAGHGGHDTGTVGPTGLMEKDLVLDVAHRVGALLVEKLGCEVVYTRSDDTFIPLEERTAIANERHADLFLSIHANSSDYKTVAGVETYYLNFTTSKAAMDVAARENATSQKTVFELLVLLQKIALKDKVDESREFALRVQNAMYASSLKTNPRSRDRGVRKAPFIVLIGANMPSVLAEIGFISNPHDEAMMKKPEYRQKIAESLYKGVASYASTLSHFQVAETRVKN